MGTCLLKYLEKPLEYSKWQIIINYNYYIISVVWRNKNWGYNIFTNTFRSTLLSLTAWILLWIRKSSLHELCKFSKFSKENLHSSGRNGTSFRNRACLILLTTFFSIEPQCTWSHVGCFKRNVIHLHSWFMVSVAWIILKILNVHTFVPIYFNMKAAI